MFEKDAEEIANKSLCTKMMCYNHCNFNSPKHHRCGEWHREYECALKGAEFGYNKANENFSKMIVYKFTSITQQGFEIICKHLADKDNAIKKLIADMAGLEEELTEKDKQITGLKEENDQLKAQIEKMKCCGNCGNWTWNMSNKKCQWRCESREACNNWEIEK